MSYFESKVAGSSLPTYTLEASNFRSSLRGLQWEAPRLREQDDSRGVTKQEAFCWILFGSSNATTVIRFAHGEPLLQLLLALFTYWSLYSASADYSTRFNTDGLDHGLFYMLLAICIFVMDVNWTGLAADEFATPRVVEA
eukprot:g32073.t1